MYKKLALLSLTFMMPLCGKGECDKSCGSSLISGLLIGAVVSIASWEMTRLRQCVYNYFDKKNALQVTINSPEEEQANQREIEDLNAQDSANQKSFNASVADFNRCMEESSKEAQAGKPRRECTVSGRLVEDRMHKTRVITKDYNIRRAAAEQYKSTCEAAKNITEPTKLTGEQL